MNFIYICRDGENEELRYSIRSVLHHYPKAEILVVGGKPRWYAGKYLPVNDFGNKFDNINQCYKAICKITSIDDFVLMNDDFFILNKPKNIEYFYDGTLDNKIENHMSIYGISKYSRVLSEANKKLKKMGIDHPLNYDVHTPMLFNRKLLSEVIDLSSAPRSMYGNIFKVGGTKIKDVKIYSGKDSVDINNYFISTEDNSFKVVYDILLKDKFHHSTKQEYRTIQTADIY